MKTPTELLVETITEDRIKVLFRLFKDYPIHGVSKIFSEMFDVSISSDQLSEFYKIWEPNKRYSSSSLRKKLQENEEWVKFEKNLKSQTVNDVSAFMYYHWKQHRKNQNK